MPAYSSVVMSRPPKDALALSSGKDAYDEVLSQIAIIRVSSRALVFIRDYLSRTCEWLQNVMAGMAGAFQDYRIVTIELP